MRSTDPVASKWFRLVRFRLASIYALSVGILSALILFAVYQVELHGCEAHHSEQIAHALVGAWFALFALSAAVGYFFAPFITRAAEDAMENLSRSADAIAHDLRAPLTRLRVRSEMEATKEGPAAEFAAEVSSDTHTLLNLVNTLLEISRLERTGGDDAREDVGLQDLALEVAELFEPVAEDLGITLTVSPQHEPVVLSCHRAKMRQVIGNLVDNALKHTPRGGRVTISVTRSNGTRLLRVSDSGEGIPADELPHIFEKFHRGKSNLHPGNGLGLALVRAIVTSYDGKVSVKSAPGLGTTFTATF